MWNVSCALEKKVYSSAFGWNVLKIPMRSISSNVSFKTCVSLLIFCFGDLSISVSKVLVSYYYCVTVNFSFYVCECLSSEKSIAPHSCTLAWKIPWTEEPGRLQSMRSLRVGHD